MDYSLARLEKKGREEGGKESGPFALVTKVTPSSAMRVRRRWKSKDRERREKGRTGKLLVMNNRLRASCRTLGRRRRSFLRCLNSWRDLREEVRDSLPEGRGAWALCRKKQERRKREGKGGRLANSSRRSVAGSSVPPDSGQESEESRALEKQNEAREGWMERRKRVSSLPAEKR